MSHRSAFHILLAAVLVCGGVRENRALSHTVTGSDTLYGLSDRYDIPAAWIIRANNLPDPTIRIGEILEIPVEGIPRLVVRPGDTLSGISAELDVSMDEILGYNGLETGELQIGQILRIPPPSPDGTHRVAPGESLWSVARRYGVAVADLKAWNGLPADPTIHPGEILTIVPGPGSPAPAKLRLSDGGETALAAVERPAPEAQGIPRDGEYFYSAPQSAAQPSVSYWEGSSASPLRDYRRAEKVLEAFKAELSRMAPLGRGLDGWHIVIDPGHGGLDPGAIVSVKDGNGNPVVVTEDEYAYDISLRLYRLLSRHGASVSLTVMAPDHQVRNGKDARTTFVNRKSEVYADLRHNEGPGWRPVGTIAGLEKRKSIAAASIKAAQAAQRRNGTLFLSIHADNSPDLPVGTAVLFDGSDGEELGRSKSLAAVLAPYLGTGSFVRRQSLKVLKDNPADAAVLVEARNIHYESNAWALRSAELREQDAGMIARGVLAWAAR